MFSDVTHFRPVPSLILERGLQIELDRQKETPDFANGEVGGTQNFG